jgi:hypothetical protein
MANPCFKFTREFLLGASADEIKSHLSSCVRFKDCRECLTCHHTDTCRCCKDCKECWCTHDSEDCTRCRDCTHCDKCTDCQSCENCYECSDCVGCYYLHGCRFMIGNVQLTEEEFRQVVEKLTA